MRSVMIHARRGLARADPPVLGVRPWPWPAPRRRCAALGPVQRFQVAGEQALRRALLRGVRQLLAAPSAGELGEPANEGRLLSVGLFSQPQSPAAWADTIR